MHTDFNFNLSAMIFTDTEECQQVIKYMIRNLFNPNNTGEKLLLIGWYTRDNFVIPEKEMLQRGQL